MPDQLISVIIPLYNKELIIKRTIQSVLGQSLRDFELIIVNDGSTDNSYKVVKSIKDKRIIYIEQENGGPGKARNTGVEHCHGDWILFLDADDELADGALQHLYEYTQKHLEANVIDGSFIVKTRKGNQPHILAEDWLVEDNFKALFYREIMPSTGHTLFKTALVRRFPYDTTIRRYEDVELLMRLLKEAKVITTARPIFYVNAKYASASTARQSISEDFLGHLDFKGKSFCENGCYSSADLL